MKYAFNRVSPRAVKTDSFNRVGNAPHVARRNTVPRRWPRGALPTRLNDAGSILAARGITARTPAQIRQLFIKDRKRLGAQIRSSESAFPPRSRWFLHDLDQLTQLLLVLRLGGLRFFLCRFRGSDRGFGFGFGEGSYLDVFQTRDG